MAVEFRSHLSRLIRSRKMSTQGRYAYKILIGNRKRPLEISRHRQENNIKMDLKECGIKM
jgi:hypothetical protein